MKVEQFVMAYLVEQDRLRSILPAGFESLRPVLRINAEITNDQTAYVELNTAVSAKGKRGWLNIGCWEDVPFEKNGKTTLFQTDLLKISFTGMGVAGGCPAEKDNDGCFFIQEKTILRLPEKIDAHKEYCDCAFAWKSGAEGASIGKTLPAFPEEIKNTYPKQAFTVKNAASIPCRQVLGSYMVCFER